MHKEAAAGALPALDWESAEQLGFAKTLIHVKKAPAPVRSIRGLTQKQVKEFVDGERRRCCVGFHIQGLKGGPLDGDKKQRGGKEVSEQERPFEQGFSAAATTGMARLFPRSSGCEAKGIGSSKALAAKPASSCAGPARTAT